MLIGYKEWSLVCEALGAGVQTLLLRRGGIAEGREGFAFKYSRFYLFPTLFHQQEEQVRWSPSRQQELRSGDGSWLISQEVEVMATAILTDWEKVEALAPFHIWKEGVVRERFGYEGGNRIHAALVRVKKLSGTLCFAETKELRGCRSWVEYPGVEERSPGESRSVLTNEAFSIIQTRVEILLKS